MLQEKLSKQLTLDHRNWKKMFPVAQNAIAERIVSIGFAQLIQTLAGSKAMMETRFRKLHLISEGRIRTLFGGGGSESTLFESWDNRSVMLLLLFNM